MDRNNKGFTLIELLVVIAIIGILAALVLVALGNARTKATDSRIKSNVSQLRILAEIVFDNNESSYDTVASCFNSGTGCGNTTTATNVSVVKADLTKAGSSITGVSSDENAYCVSAALVSGGSYCVDSTGVAKANSTCSSLACP